MPDEKNVCANCGKSPSNLVAHDGKWYCPGACDVTRKAPTKKKAAKLSPARAQFLKDASEEHGISAVESYPPAKWAVEQGYVRVVEGRYGGRTHYITPAGEEFLKQANAG